jgi:hypothetical protein
MEFRMVLKLLAYQLSGSSSGPLPNWRWMQVNLISDLLLLKETFPGGVKVLPPSQTFPDRVRNLIWVLVADAESLPVV